MQEGTPDRPPAAADGSTPPDGADALVGRDLHDGRFFIERELGRGTYSVVYRAWDRERDEPCAVKVQVGIIDEQLRDRFQGEVDALLRLRHPAVLQLRAAGRLADRGYLVADLVEGGSLLDRIRDHGPLPVEEAAAVALHVLSALGAAHAAGVVHRDVKPGNVLVDDRGQVRLADFGSARDAAAAVARHTATGDALGTFLYMAPEQRVDARQVGPPADLYAAGVLLVRSTATFKPRDLFMVPVEDPRWAQVPESIREVCFRATRLDLLARYATAAHMAEALLAGLPADRAAAMRAIPHLDPRGWAPPHPGLPHTPGPAGTAEESTRSVEPVAVVTAPQPPPAPAAADVAPPPPEAPAPPPDEPRKVLVPLIGALLIGAALAVLILALSHEPR